MKRDQKTRDRKRKYRRIIRRNKRRSQSARTFHEARRLAREARGLAPCDPAPFKKLELAPQLKINGLHIQVRALLKAFGHPEALVTDRSLVCDMVRDGRKLVAVRRKLKIAISTKDFIFTVAERLLAKHK